MRCRDCEACELLVRKVHPASDPTKWATFPDAPTQVLHAYDSQSVDQKTGVPKGPYCDRFRDRVSWFRAFDRATAPPLVYLAHPVSGDFRANITDAKAWLRWLRSLSLDALRLRLGMTDLPALPFVNAPWLADPFDGDKDTAFRKRHMEGCMATASRHDEVWVVVRFSKGVQQEADAGRRVRDLTHLGKNVPTWRG